MCIKAYKRYITDLLMEQIFCMCRLFKTHWETGNEIHIIVFSVCLVSLSVSFALSLPLSLSLCLSFFLSVFLSLSLFFCLSVSVFLGLSLCLPVSLGSRVGVGRCLLFFGLVSCSISPHHHYQAVCQHCLSTVPAASQLPTSLSPSFLLTSSVFHY